jgi:O-Antigen ligase
MPCYYSPSFRTSSQSLQFLLLLLLLFYIQIETTLPGRAYTHYLGLNADYSLNGGLLTFIQGLCLLTIIIPFLIWATSMQAVQNTNLSSLMIRLGLCLWLGGAVISTLAHFENSFVILNFVAGIGSAAGVFFGLRRFRFASTRYVEASFAAIALGALIPAVQCISGFYRAWGVPTLSTLLVVRYDVTHWQTASPFGNPDNVATLYLLLACPCLAIIFLNTFTRKTRLLAWGLLLCSVANLVLAMARASLIAFLFAVLCANIMTRNRRAWIASTVAVLLVLAFLAPQIRILQDYFGTAVRVDVRDRSVQERIESIQVSWQHFLNNPIIGVGANQSPTFVAQSEAHELAIWQAAEHGALGFLGVLLITAASLGRLVELLKSGRGRHHLSLEFIFLLGPAMYFVKGLFADVSINNTVVNTWICSVFAMLAISDALAGGFGSNERLRIADPRLIVTPVLARVRQVSS